MSRERTVGHARTAARGSQFLDYAFYVVYSLLAIRLVLALIGARPANGFVQFIRAPHRPVLRAVPRHRLEPGRQRRRDARAAHRDRRGRVHDAARGDQRAAPDGRNRKTTI
jgi:hypothetical protein